MYLPVTYSPAPAPAAGLGNYRPMSASLQESEFYPPPYDSLNPLGRGGACGMGMFDSADLSTWGFPEWAAIGLGLYLGVKILGDVGRGTKRVRQAVRRRGYRAKRKATLQKELREL